jgi:hypothetical protein
MLSEQQEEKYDPHEIAENVRKALPPAIRDKCHIIVTISAGGVARIEIRRYNRKRGHGEGAAQQG